MLTSSRYLKRGNRKASEIRNTKFSKPMCYLDLVLEGGKGGADGEQDEQHEEQQKGDRYLGGESKR